MKNKVILWIVLFLWESMVFSFSNQSGSTSTGTSNKVSNLSISVMESIGNFELSKEEKGKLVSNMTVLVRKIAHMTEYFILGIILVLLGRAYQWTVFEIVLLCLLFALLDEIHQLWILGRAGSILDVGIDMLGSGLSILIVKKGPN